jgi:cytochrome P450
VSTQPEIGLLADPNTFLHSVPHDQIAALRAESPVAWQPMEGEPGFWAVLTHADVVKVSRAANLFSASEGGVVLENLDAASLEMMRMMLLAMDPPMHNEYRRPLSEPFKGKIIAGLEPRIAEISRELMADVAGRDSVEFVHEVTSGLPTKVMGRLMGLPEADWDLLHSLAERQTSGSDPEIVGDEPDYSASIEMAMYAIEFAARRRSEPPREDLTTLILDGEFGGQPMSDVDFGSFFVQIVTAGNDTTKSMLSSGLWALLQHPEQLQELRDDPSLIPGAVEEILRWVNPLHYFRRTASEDTELSGVQISAGDKVVMYYTSANRDEAVFDEPNRFNIHRNPNPHLSFGIGEHFCLGVHLARLEGRVFFTELLRSFARIELAGDPVRVRSNLNNSFKRLPVRLLDYR